VKSENVTNSILYIVSNFQVDCACLHFMSFYLLSFGQLVSYFYSGLSTKHRYNDNCLLTPLSHQNMRSFLLSNANAIITRNAAVVSKQATAVYAERGSNPLSTVAKVGQGKSTKDASGCLTSAILANMNVLVQVVGVLEPENRNVGQGVLTFLCEG